MTVKESETLKDELLWWNYISVYNDKCLLDSNFKSLTECSEAVANDILIPDDLKNVW